MPDRPGELRKRIGEAGVDALFVTDMANIRYLSGFTGSSAFIVMGRRGGWFLTDSRYTEQAQKEVKGFYKRTYKKAFEEAAGIIKKLGAKTIGFEADSINYSNYQKLSKNFRGIRLKPLHGIVEEHRARKDSTEIRRIRESVAILDKGFALAQKLLKPGAVEKQAAFELEFAFKKWGADGLAFDAIIASGARGALAHGKASEKKIRKGEFVVVDMGVLLNGYNSDETRTFCIGKPAREQKKVYDTVLGAQLSAIGAIRPGVKASAVDSAARDYIKKAGYGKYFGHGTGHGVGLRIHEAPGIGPMSKDVLEEGMVVTVEPGIYIPGFGGVRIEDMALVNKNGCEILTRTAKELVCL